MQPPDQPQDAGKTDHPQADQEPSKTRKEIPLVSVPNDRDLIAEEMEELFNEDRVTHQHGNTEPEAD